MKDKILIFSGDPNSINSEIIYKGWKKINSKIKKKIYLISNYDLLQKQFNKLNYKIKLQKVNDINETTLSNIIKVIHVNLKFKQPFKVSKKFSSDFVKNSFKIAHNLSLNNKVMGLINCPINKNLLGGNKIGVTEFLAKKCKVKKDSEVMVLRNKKVSVSPITTHLDLKDVSKKINKKIIVNKIKTIDLWFKKKFKKKPIIGILGLNPHNAEMRKNSEEKKIIIPAILGLKRLNIKVYGPLVADTLFIQDYKKFDVIVGMYHDQVITPFKTIFKFDAINITLGLKYLRVSPDHGTAANLIGKNKSNCASFVKCIEFVNKFGK